MKKLEIERLKEKNTFNCIRRQRELNSPAMIVSKRFRRKREERKKQEQNKDNTDWILSRTDKRVQDSSSSRRKDGAQAAPSQAQTESIGIEEERRILETLFMSDGSCTEEGEERRADRQERDPCWVNGNCIDFRPTSSADKKGCLMVSPFSLPPANNKVSDSLSSLLLLLLFFCHHHQLYSNQSEHFWLKFRLYCEHDFLMRSLCAILVMELEDENDNWNNISE